MKVTKQTLYNNKLSRRPITLEAVVELVKDEETKQKVEAFRYKFQRALLGQRTALMNRMPQLLFAASFRKDEMTEYNGWVQLTVPHLKNTAEVAEVKRKIAALDRNERYWLTHDEEVQLMGENEAFRRRPIYEDLFHKYFRPAASGEEGEKMSAGELYFAIQQKSKVKLPAGKLPYFGRFLKKVIGEGVKNNRGMTYRVVEK